MTKQLAKSFTMLMLVGTLTLVTGIVSAKAQSRQARATVPFEFVVGDKVLPAGDYRISAATAGSEVLRIGNAANASVARMTIPASGSSREAKLVFHRYGQRYFLAEVWSGQGFEGRLLMKSRQERAIEKENAKLASLNGPAARHTYESVVIASLVR